MNISKFISVHKLIPAFITLVAITSCASSETKQSENADNTATTDTTIVKNDIAQFVIYNVDMNCDAIKNGDFIFMGELPYTDRPDSTFEGFTLPSIKAVITAHKEVIGKFTNDATEYIIDGDKSDKNGLEALDAEKIQRVTIDGNTLLIETRLSLDEPNPDVKMAIDNEARIIKRSAQD